MLNRYSVPVIKWPSRYVLKILAMIYLFVCACGNTDQNTADMEHFGEDEIPAAGVQNIQHKLVTGKPYRTVLPGKGIYRARLNLNYDNYSGVSLPMDAFINKILVKEGQKVKKGDPLFVIGHPGLYKLQSAFIEAKEMTAYHEQELHRKGDLSLDYASSLRSFQIAERDYKSALASLEAYDRKLSFLGISGDSIIKSGMVDEIEIYAPLEGTVIKCISGTGKFYNLGHQVAGIFSPGNFTAETHMDLSDVREFQESDDFFFTPGLENSKSIPVTLTGISQFITKDQLVTGFFRLNINDQVIASAGEIFKPGLNGWISHEKKPEDSVLVPAGSAITCEDGRFIFAFHNNKYMKIKVITGINIDGMVEIKNPGKLPDGAKIVFQGAEILNNYFASAVDKTSEE